MGQRWHLDNGRKAVFLRPVSSFIKLILKSCHWDEACLLGHSTGPFYPYNFPQGQEWNLRIPDCTGMGLAYQCLHGQRKTVDLSAGWPINPINEGLVDPPEMTHKTTLGPKEMLCEQPVLTLNVLVNKDQADKLCYQGEQQKTPLTRFCLTSVLCFLWSLAHLKVRKRRKWVLLCHSNAFSEHHLSVSC